MKKGILTVFTMLFAVLLVAAIPTEAEAAIYDDTVRLHILANSDSEDDQRLKLDIRDAILREFGTRLSGLESKALAEAEISSLLPLIEEFAEEKIRLMGYSYSVSASIGEEWYDTRSYEDFSLPSGIYTSLIIKIGKGEGRNWWCVMFPPLCLDVACEDAPPDDCVIDYTREELILISTEKYNVKFKMLELLSGVFR